MFKFIKKHIIDPIKELLEQIGCDQSEEVEDKYNKHMNKIRIRAWDGEQMSCFSIEIDSSGRLTVPPIPAKGKPFKVLMLDTGLKDKKGNRIHDGDIINYDDCYADEIVFGKIGYDGSFNGLTGFGLKSWLRSDGTFIELSYDFDASLIEVIGNIYQNPELLTNKE